MGKVLDNASLMEQTGLYIDKYNNKHIVYDSAQQKRAEMRDQVMAELELP